MNAKLTKILSIVLSLVVIVASFLTVASFATDSLFTYKFSTDQTLSEDYELGSYTKDFVIDEIDVGIIETINIITDFHRIRLLMGIQTHEHTLRSLYEILDARKTEYAEFKDSYGGDTGDPYYKDRCSEFEAKINEANANIDKENAEHKKWLEEEYTDEEINSVNDWLLEEDYVNSIATLYYIFSLNDSEEPDETRNVCSGSYVLWDDSGELTHEGVNMIVPFEKLYFSHNPMPEIVVRVFGGIFLGILALFAIISMIALFVKSLKSLIVLLTKIKKTDDPIELFGSSEITSATLTLLVIVMLIKIIFGTHIQIGAWINVAVIATLISAVASILVKIFASKFEISLLIKTGIGAVSVTLAGLILTSALNAGIVPTMLDKFGSFEEKVFKTSFAENYIEIFKEKEDTLNGYFSSLDMEGYEEELENIRQEAKIAAEEKIKSLTVDYITIICAVLLLASASLAVFGSLVHRFAGDRIVSSDDPVGIDYGASYIAPIFIIASIIIISVFNVSSVDDVKDAVVDGKYKIFIGEYAVEDSIDHTEYTFATEIYKAADETVKIADEAIEKETDTEKKNSLIAERNNINRSGNIFKNLAAELEGNNFSIVKNLVLALVLLLIEIGYKIILIREEKKAKDNEGTEEVKEEQLNKETEEAKEEPKEENTDEAVDEEKNEELTEA